MRELVAQGLDGLVTMGVGGGVGSQMVGGGRNEDEIYD